MNDDRTNVLTWTGVWDLPFGQGAKYLAPNPPKVLGYLINNWRFSWVFSEESGLPVSTVEASGGYWKINSHTYTPDRGPTFAQWIYNCDGVPANCYESIPSDGQGNLPDRISSLRMYSVPDFDVALEKNIPITESKTLQVRADAFNMTNTPYFGSLETDPTSNGGKITQSANGSWNGFGTVSNSQYNFPRIIQLSLKFRF
jgi:hypothetical protein